jgi:ligand-binding sensor domain-containing protein
MKILPFIFILIFAGSLSSQPDVKDRFFVETLDTVSPYAPISITRNILEDTKGNIWIMSFQGIIKYDGKVFTNYTLKENLIHFHVFSVMEDRSGNIWFGTVGGGVYKYNGKTFTLFTTDNGLADNIISCMMEDKDGNIWFGTDEGISRLDTSILGRTRINGSVTTLSGLSLTSKKGFTNYTTANGLCGNRVNSIIQDKSGKIWVGTRSGVSSYDGKTFTGFTINGQPFTNVRTIKEDRSGNIWISGQDGLYCYDPLAKAEISLKKIMPEFTCNVFEDKAGNLWFSSLEGKGMTLYKYDKKVITKIIEKTEEGDNQIFEVTEDKKGNIWFGKMAGVCRYDGKTFNYFKN